MAKMTLHEGKFAGDGQSGKGEVEAGAENRQLSAP